MPVGLGSYQSNLTVGSSTPSSQENIDRRHNHHREQQPLQGGPSQGSIAKKAYNYAILADDVMEESALLSTSDDVGYFAERESSFASRASSYADDYDDADGEEAHPNARPIFADSFEPGYGSSGSQQGKHNRYDAINDHHSVHSEVSESHLLDEAREEHSLIKWYRRPSLLMITIVMFLYMFTVGVGMTSELQLLLYAVCWTKNGDLSHCQTPDVQRTTASLQKWTSSLTAIIKILVCGNISSLSDLYGRKPLVLYTFTMSLLSRLLLIFVFTPRFFSPLFYILSQLVDALGGSIFVMLALSNSYVVDVVQNVDRLHSLGKVTAGLYLGMALGPVLSSLLSFPATRLLRLCAILMFISTILTLVFLPESRSSKLRTKSRRQSTRSLTLVSERPRWYNKLKLTAIVDSFISLKLLWITRKDPNTGKLDISARLNVLYLLAMEILLASCQVGAGAAVAMYCIYWYSWNQNKLGILIGFAAGGRAIVLNWFNPWFHRKLKDSFIYHSTSIDFIDIITLSVAVASFLLAGLACCLITSEAGMFLYVIFSAFEGLTSPTIHSAILKYNSNSSKNGAFFGALALIKNLINLVSPIVFLSLYVISLTTWRPLIFGVTTLFALISVFLLCCLRIDNA